MATPQLTLNCITGNDMTTKPRKRYYAGLLAGTIGRKFHLLAFDYDPTAGGTPVVVNSVTYAALIGPFRTKRGAVYCVDNPTHQLQNVSQIERAAEVAAGQSLLCSEFTQHNATSVGKLVSKGLRDDKRAAFLARKGENE